MTVHICTQGNIRTTYIDGGKLRQQEIGLEWIRTTIDSWPDWESAKKDFKNGLIDGRPIRWDMDLKTFQKGPG